MIAGHARLARRLGTELGLPDGGARRARRRRTRCGTARACPASARATDIPDRQPDRAARRVHGGRAPHRRRRRAPSSWRGGGPGKQFDPDLVDLLCADAEKVFHGLDETESWDAVHRRRASAGPRCCRRRSATRRWRRSADFVDLKSPYTLGHSTAVAELASAAAAALGARRRRGRRSCAGPRWCMRFGCLGVSNAIWDKPGPSRRRSGSASGCTPT